MSFPPSPPGLVELKYKLSWSLATAGAVSPNTELTTGPRFTGADQSENSGAAVGDDTLSASRTMTVTANLRRTMHCSF
jgi:hypothetical protein